MCLNLNISGILSHKYVLYIYIRFYQRLIFISATYVYINIYLYKYIMCMYLNISGILNHIYFHLVGSVPTKDMQTPPPQF